MHFLEELAEVVELSGAKAVLALPRQSACRECGICSASATGVMRLEVENRLGLSKGEKVRIVMRTTRLKISVMLFGVPALLFLVPVMLCAAVGRHELGLLAGVPALAAYLPILRRYAAIKEPVVTRIPVREEK